MFKLGVMAVALVAGSVFAAGIPSGDARRGEQLFQSQQCVACHSVNGRGGTTAPDLAKRIDRDYTPTSMASLMWNHAPEMWVAMLKQGIIRPALTPEQSADLFAYFVSAHYFEKPGDAARGKRAFTTKHCAECHGIATSSFPGAPPVAKWDSLADPSLLAQQMWNHGGQMRQAFAQNKMGRAFRLKNNTFSRLKPIWMEWRLERVGANKPAATTSNKEMAICDTTKTWLKPMRIPACRSRPRGALARVSFHAGVRSTRVPCKAGAKPKSSPQTTARANVKPNTCQSMAACKVNLSRPLASSQVMDRIPQAATSTPSAPPRMERSEEHTSELQSFRHLVC